MVGEVLVPQDIVLKASQGGRLGADAVCRERALRGDVIDEALFIAGQARENQGECLEAVVLVWMYS